MSRGAVGGQLLFDQPSKLVERRGTGRLQGHDQRLDRILLEAFVHIWERADAARIGLRTATYLVACERILSARQARGLYP